jgi:hypothetical protein
VVASALVKKYCLSFSKALQGTAASAFAPIFIGQSSYSIEQTGFATEQFRRRAGELAKACPRACFALPNAGQQAKISSYAL